MTTGRITITLVRVTTADGGSTLIGRTVSDRWNLLQFGVTSIADSRNQSALKRVRRLVGADFRVTVSRTEAACFAPTSAESSSLGAACLDVAAVYAAGNTAAALADRSVSLPA